MVPKQNGAHAEIWGWAQVRYVHKFLSVWLIFSFMLISVQFLVKQASIVNRKPVAVRCISIASHSILNC